jgi:hypothetical protein
MTSGKPLTAAETKHIQELMKAGKRDDCDFLFAFHDVYDAVSFALTFQVYILLSFFFSFFVASKLFATYHIGLLFFFLFFLLINIMLFQIYRMS